MDSDLRTANAASKQCAGATPGERELHYSEGTDVARRLVDGEEPSAV